MRAPIDGVIQTRTVETGQYVQAGYVMATLLRSDPMLLRFQVEPDDAPRLKPGMIGDVHDARDAAHVHREDHARRRRRRPDDAHGRRSPARSSTTSTSTGCAPARSATSRVDLGAERDAPLIPRIAARATDHGYVAYVVEGDVAKERAAHARA